MATSLARFEFSGLLVVGKPKYLVYVALFDNEEALHVRIVDAGLTIRNYPGIFERIIRHVEARIESHGGHFEHLL
jgi:signal transduction histidine kinase